MVIKLFLAQMTVHIHVDFVAFIYSLFMIDNSGWLATLEVYGNGIKHLLCHWHVDQ